MYVIGTDEYSFIRIMNYQTFYDAHRMWSEIIYIEYKTPLHQATIFNTYDKAESILKEIKDNVENITFGNYNIIAVLDKDLERSFDKIAYSNKLKIYKLTPMEVRDRR